VKGAPGGAVLDTSSGKAEGDYLEEGEHRVLTTRQLRDRLVNRSLCE
jgi:hypothetical protein